MIFRLIEKHIKMDLYCLIVTKYTIVHVAIINTFNNIFNKTW